MIGALFKTPRGRPNMVHMLLISTLERAETSGSLEFEPKLVCILPQGYIVRHY